MARSNPLRNAEGIEAIAEVTAKLGGALGLVLDAPGAQQHAGGAIKTGKKDQPDAFAQCRHAPGSTRHGTPHGRQGKQSDQPGNDQQATHRQRAGVMIDEVPPGKQKAGESFRIAATVGKDQGKARHDVTEQKEGDDGTDRHQQDRVDGGADNLLFQIGDLFVKDDVALKRFRHVAGAFTGPDRRHIQIGKCLGMVLQRGGQRLAFTQVRQQAAQDIGSRRTLILLGQGFQAFNHGQAGFQQGQHLSGKQGQRKLAAPPG